jgi:hypothetical protein
MNDLNDRFRSLDLVGPRDLWSEAQRRARSTVLSPARERRPIVVIASAAAAVLLVIGGTALLVRSDRGEAPQSAVPPVGAEEPTTLPAATSTTLPATTTTTTPMPDGGWRRVFADPSTSLWGVTSGGPGLVAFGMGATAEMNAAVLTSIDGTTWEPVPADQAALTFGMVLFERIIDTGERIIAVGEGCDQPDLECTVRPGAWISDDGVLWERVTLPGDGGATKDAITTPDGIFAVGTECTATGESCRPAVWTSPAGVEWSQTWSGEPHSYGGAGMPAIGSMSYSLMQATTIGPDASLVSVGVRCEDATGCAAAAWTSPDGTVWQRAAHDPAAFSEGTIMLNVVSGESGLIAVGLDGENGAVWTSSDGQTWNRVPDADGTFAGLTIADIAVGENGFIAVGPDSATAAPTGGVVWTSPDGQTWDVAAELDARYLLAVSEYGQGFVIAGMTADGGVIWLDPAATTPPETP